jgi:hypothetical protein
VAGPQRADPARVLLVAAHGGDDERAAGRDEVLHQLGGPVVEQVGVVDAEDEASRTGRAQRPGGRGHRVGVGRNEVVERAERDRPHGAGAQRPRGAVPGPRGPADQLRREAGLPDARRAGEDDPGRVRPQHRREQLHLLGAADQPPLRHSAHASSCRPRMPSLA